MLTNGQRNTLLADIQAHQDTLDAYNLGDTAMLANLYNAETATTAWNSQAPVSEIFAAVTWANFTPNAAPDGSAMFTNVMLSVQTKQMNLQNMLMGRDFINASLNKTRVGLRDALTNLPTGNNYTIKDAGGDAALTACIRPSPANRIEKLFSSGPATTGGVTADRLTYEGSISPTDFNGL